jgi:hypothetical protein
VPEDPQNLFKKNRSKVLQNKIFVGKIIFGWDKLALGGVGWKGKWFGGVRD